MDHLCASYNEPLLIKEEREVTIERAISKLHKIRKHTDFYALAISGTSGILGAIIADRMGLDLIVVRGKSVKAHSSRLAEGRFINGGYIFFDDLIDSGETLARVHSAIQTQVCESNVAVANNMEYYGRSADWMDPLVSCPKLVGVLLYDSWQPEGRKVFDSIFDDLRTMPNVPVWGLK